MSTTNAPIVTESAYLTLHYRLATADGTDIVTTFNGNPATLMLGQGQLAPFLEDLLIGLPSEGAQPGRVLRGKMPADLEDRLLHDLDVLVSANRVIETLQHAPEHALQPNTQAVPSVHLRVRYESGRSWMSWYAMSEVPSHIASLVEDCRLLARRVMDAATQPPTGG